MLEEEKNGFGMSFYNKTMCIVSFPNPLAPDTCQLGNPTTCALHSVHRSGAPYSMMSVSSFPILPVLARFLHPLIFQSGLCPPTLVTLVTCSHDSNTIGTARIHFVYIQCIPANQSGPIVLARSLFRCESIFVCLPTCPGVFSLLAPYRQQKKVWNHLSNSKKTTRQNTFFVHLL